MVALGSVGEHCLEQLAASMPGLVQLVHSNLDSENASLVGISCWWLGQFGQWFAEQALEGRTGPLEATVRKVMKLFLNPKKSIQFSVSWLVLVAAFFLFFFTFSSRTQLQ